MSGGDRDQDQEVEASPLPSVLLGLDDARFFLPGVNESIAEKTPVVKAFMDMRAEGILGPDQLNRSPLMPNDPSLMLLPVASNLLLKLRLLLLSSVIL